MISFTDGYVIECHSGHLLNLLLIFLRAKQIALHRGHCWYRVPTGKIR